MPADPAGGPAAVVEPAAVRRRRGWRRLRAALLAPTLAALQALLRPLGWRGGQRAGAALGWLAWRLARRDRQRAREHLALALPELPPAERERIARASFMHLGTAFAEILFMLRSDSAAMVKRIDVEGWEAVAQARAAGRPLLVLTAHCGNWELLSAAMDANGLNVSAVARQQDDPVFEEVIVRLRTRYGQRTLSRGTRGAARELLRALRNGALLMLIDQDTRVEGDWVPFFGRLAYTPTGAAQIALRQDAAVLPMFAERLADGRHLVRVLPALELPADVLAATALMTRTIEEQVRRRPEQWVWLHRRWRRRPPGERAAEAGDAPGAATPG
jgi:Kdo2-lipid IVA lauroyltransferase/acyltransferase